MGRSIYSFGLDSPLKFKISDRLAADFNAAAEKYFKAQIRLNQRFGKPWDPDVKPVTLGWTPTQKRAWNEFWALFARVLGETGPYHENELMEDFLVKNSTGAVATAPKKGGRLITLAVAGGVLYSILRRL